jgi:hypothetical protein
MIERDRQSMSTITSGRELLSASAEDVLIRLGTACEVLLVYAGVLLYIWRWQYTHSWMWMPLLAAVLFSRVLHGDTLRDLGLTTAELYENARIILILAVGLYLPVLLYGLFRHSLVLSLPRIAASKWFCGYGACCVFQQYLMQSYFHHRLLSVIESRHLSSLLVAIMFGAAHIPNPILMVVTTLGGFLLAEVFAVHRNIWPLALAQTVGGLLVAALSPASLIHNMRVGPGYFFYRVRG